MYTGDTYLPTKIILGPGRLVELKDETLPGKKALICITEDQLMQKLGILDRVTTLLEENGTTYEIFDKVKPNPFDG